MFTSDRRRFLACEVLRLRQAGRSQREISRALRLARKTVKRMLAEVEERREKGDSAVDRVVGRPRVPKGSKLDACDDRIRAWLEQYPDMTAVRCLEKLEEEEHFAGGYTLADGLSVQTWRNTLCWSRGMHLAGANNTRQTTTLTMLRLGFERWKGVPRECVTGSMPGVVDRWECDLLNARYVDFAAH